MVLAWAVLAFIVYATLSPLGLRPHLGSGVGAERFGAFAVVGLLFGLAYPKRLWLVLAIVLGTAVLLETLQYLTPDRHGRVADALVKLAGGAVGAGLSLVSNRALATIETQRPGFQDPPGRT
ncbi:MAG: hypothetical protein JWP84_1986 [Tardiphaga sp.]|nr:hypothetical protein [Tardiphaga sp.]